MPWDRKPNALTTKPATAAAQSTENLCYLRDNHINVASSGPDPNPRGGGQLH